MMCACALLAVRYADIPNMGDQLNPLIFERIFGYGIVPVAQNQADVFALGSGLKSLATRKNTRRVAVWGTGFISYDDCAPPTGRGIDYCAVRGKLTKRRIELKLGRALDIPVADPGLLASRLLEHPATKKHDLGIIAHWREQEDPRFVQLAKLAKRPHVIDVRDHPMSVIRQISSCERILSSSLHGLIVADSLGIPNLHVKVTDRLLGDGFKFDDYYSSFEVPHEFVDLNTERVESLEVIDRRYRITPAAVAEKQRMLLESFPFPPAQPQRVPRISWTSLVIPWGLLRRRASRRMGVGRFISERGKSQPGLWRMLKFTIPFGLVAGWRAWKFREPLPDLLSGAALVKTLNWRW